MKIKSSLEILNELKLFSKFKIKFYKDINLCTADSLNKDKLIVFFYTKKGKENYEKIIQNNLPAIIINQSTEPKNVLKGEFVDQLIMPFRILDLKKKVVSLLAKYKIPQKFFN